MGSAGLINKQMQVQGGVYIPLGTGGVNLFDWISESDTTQDLVDQTYNAVSTLYITLHPAIKSFMLYGIKVGYVSTAAAVDDLADVILYSGTHASSAYLAETKYIWNSGAIAETPLTGAPSVTWLNSPRLVNLDTSGRLYFKTNWTTAVINVNEASEFFYLIIYGIQTETV